MRSQQAAERAEQQRIKSLVLNYDMASAAADEANNSGNNSTVSTYGNGGTHTPHPSDFHYAMLPPRPNRYSNRNPSGSNGGKKQQQPVLVGAGSLNRVPPHQTQHNGRSIQQAAITNAAVTSAPSLSPQPTSLDSFVKFQHRQGSKNNPSQSQRQQQNARNRARVRSDSFMPPPSTKPN